MDMLKHGILGLLGYGSMTGYEIKKVFHESLCYFWSAQTSQIYRELQTLSRRGWASSRLIPQDGKPDKKLFSITPEGRAELNRWLTEDVSEYTIHNPLMMKVFFRGERSLDENIDYFCRLRESGDNFADNLRHTPPDTDGYAQKVDDPSKALYWRMTVRYGEMYAEMHRRWLDLCINEMEAIKDENTSDQRQS